MSVPANSIVELLRNGLNRAVNGVPSPYLEAPEQAAVNAQRRQAMIATLLQSAAPRPQGTGNTLGDMGAALAMGNQASALGLEQAMKARLLAVQMQQARNSGQARAEPSDLRMMQALGFPLTQEGFKQYEATKGTSEKGSPLAETLAQLNVLAKEQDIRRGVLEDEQKARQQRIQDATQRNQIIQSLSQTSKIGDLNEKLEGSIVANGMPLADWRRAGVGILTSLGEATGFDTKAWRKDLDYYDQLKKNLSDQLINLMSTGSLGQGTNMMLQQYQDALANTGTSPGALMAIQANIAKTLLDAADANGYEIPNRTKYEESIAKWREYDTPPNRPVVDVPNAAANLSKAAKSAATTASDIAKMTMDQLQQIDLSNLSNEAFVAVNRRYQELTRGK